MTKFNRQDRLTSLKITFLFFQILDNVIDLEDRKQIKEVIQDQELKIFKINEGIKGKITKTGAIILLIQNRSFRLPLSQIVRLKKQKKVLP